MLRTSESMFTYISTRLFSLKLHIILALMCIYLGVVFLYLEVCFIKESDEIPCDLFWNKNFTSIVGIEANVTSKWKELIFCVIVYSLSFV